MILRKRSTRFLLFVSLLALVALAACANTAPPRAGASLAAAATPTVEVDSAGSIAAKTAMTATSVMTETAAMTDTAPMTETAKVASASAPAEEVGVAMTAMEPGEFATFVAMGKDIEDVEIPAMSTAKVPSGAVVGGDIQLIVANKTMPMHDNDGVSGLVVLFEANAEISAPWGASISGGTAVEDIVSSMLQQGCGLQGQGGCEVVTIKILRADGSVETARQFSDADLDKLTKLDGGVRAKIEPSTAVTTTASMTTTVQQVETTELQPIAIKAGKAVSVPAGYVCNADARVGNETGQKLYDEGDGASETASIIVVEVDSILWSEWDGGCNGWTVQQWIDQVGKAVVFRITADGVVPVEG